MPTADRAIATALDSRIWRDFALLAMQSFVIGLAVSVLLGLAVFAMA
jgi:hypothetical protein